MVVVIGHRNRNSNKAWRLKRCDNLNEGQTKKHTFKEVSENQLCSPGMDAEILKWPCILQTKVTLGQVITQERPELSQGLTQAGPEAGLAPQYGGGHKESCFMSCACSKTWLHKVNRHERWLLLLLNIWSEHKVKSMCDA